MYVCTSSSSLHSSALPTPTEGKLMCVHVIAYIRSRYYIMYSWFKGAHNSVVCLPHSLNVGVLLANSMYIRMYVCLETLLKIDWWRQADIHFGWRMFRGNFLLHFLIYMLIHKIANIKMVISWTLTANMLWRTCPGRYTLGTVFKPLAWMDF